MTNGLDRDVGVGRCRRGRHVEFGEYMVGVAKTAFEVNECNGGVANRSLRLFREDFRRD